MAPDSPALILVVPAEMLNDNVLDTVLLLGGNGVVFRFLCAGVLDLGRGCGLSARDAHDNLTDTGFRDVGDGCGAI